MVSQIGVKQNLMIGVCQILVLQSVVGVIVAQQIVELWIEAAGFSLARS